MEKTENVSISNGISEIFQDKTGEVRISRVMWYISEQKSFQAKRRSFMGKQRHIGKQGISKELKISHTKGVN